MPIRIQRQRTKGWKMPENTVYVGRPTKWGNPYVFAMIDPDKKYETGINYVMTTFADILSAYRGFVGRCVESRGSEWLAELRGKNLACWCQLDRPCHADVLLELANSGAEAPHTPTEAK